jgi:AbrB family looped-hinge helix DNA binding protein
MPRVTQKGQVTIPLQIRSLLSIKTGDEIIFKVHKGKVTLGKKPDSVRDFSKYVGFLSHLKGERTEDIMNRLRGEPDDSGC